MKGMCEQELKEPQNPKIFEIPESVCEYYSLRINNLLLCIYAELSAFTKIIRSSLVRNRFKNVWIEQCIFTKDRIIILYIFKNNCPCNLHKFKFNILLKKKAVWYLLYLHVCNSILFTSLIKYWNCDSFQIVDFYKF